MLLIGRLILHVSNGWRPQPLPITKNTCLIFNKLSVRRLENLSLVPETSTSPEMNNIISKRTKKLTF